MYCSRCGKALRDEDKFCSFCGAKVFRTDIGKEATAEEIVFNPSFEEGEAARRESQSDYPFRGDSEGKENICFEEAITSGTGSNFENNNSSVREMTDGASEFVWDLHEFPTDAPRKTEDIDFDWSEPKANEETNEKTEASGNEATAPKAAAINRLRAARPTLRPMVHTAAMEPVTEAIYESVADEPEPTAVKEEQAIVSGEELEKELFGDINLTEADSQTVKIDKFYTFNKKNEEFQQLLDKEYEKIKRGRGLDLQLGGNAPDVNENNVKLELEQAYGAENVEEPGEMAELSQLETVGFEPWSPDAAEQEEKKEPAKEFDPVEHLRQATEEREKSLKLPPDGDIVDNDSLLRKFDTMELTKDLEELSNSRVEEQAENEIKHVIPEEPEPVKEEQPKQTPAEPSAERPFSKTQALDELFGVKQGTGEKTTELDTDNELNPKEKKKHAAVKIVLALVIILLIGELVILGIKVIAPDSGAAGFINEKLSVTYEWLLGEADEADENESDVAMGNQAPQEADVVSETPEQDKAKLISGQLSQNVNIADVSYEASLAYNPTIDYGVDDINSSTPVSNNIWYTGEDGKAVAYDRSIVGALIAFDSQWIDYVNNKDEKVFELIKADSKAYKNARNFTKAGQITETFDALHIGEIRQGETGFYVWTHEDIKITENNNTTAKSYNWIYYLEPDGQQMKIVSYYGF